MNKFVLDSSVTMAWCFEEETTSYTDSILESLSRHAEAIVPSLWPYEVANVLLGAQRRKRITHAQVVHFLSELQALPIRVHVDTTGSTGHIFGEGMALAQQHNLTSYDAAYLELALRENLPLATLDVPLKKAAQAAGVSVR